MYCFKAVDLNFSQFGKGSDFRIYITIWLVHTLAGMTHWPQTLWLGHLGRTDTLARDSLAKDTQAVDTLAKDTLAGDTLARDTLASGTLWPKTFWPE